ncbi:MAG TPA: S-adenosylmethionine:tRNA ribosyltransferase-isomerase [Actinomycetes bacterium]|nr:S-adenosylmethionine:tRNA ribosyltransferase-isomerase [Actinomycetes bacterium]
MTATLDFELPTALSAHEPPEASGLGRDGVRLLVGDRGTGEVSHHWFPELPSLLRPGDVLVVNTSATIPAAIDTTDRSGLVVHVSTELPGDRWVVELRSPAEGGSTQPYRGGVAGRTYPLRGGATVRLIEPYSDGRLWLAIIDTPKSVPLVEHLIRNGRPIRYGYVTQDWPLAAYQTVFATEPGSAEMPSAGRPFTTALVTQLVSRGVTMAPLTLHTGVASAEAHERPYPERFTVPAATARLVNAARAGGSRIIAVGTTVVRALETTGTDDGLVAPAAGWTDLVVTPQRAVHVVDGLLTGLHEPRASHLAMLEAIAGPDLLARCYRAAIEHRYRWHEFGDLNLLL